MSKFTNLVLLGLLSGFLLPTGDICAQSLYDVLSGLQSRGGSREVSEQNVWILHPDGLSYTRFIAYSSPDPIDLGCAKGGGPSDFLYFFPSNVRTRSRNSTTDEIMVPAGGYSNMSSGEFSQEDFPGVRKNEDGTYTYKHWDGKSYYGPNNRNYGLTIWNQNGSSTSFDHLTVVWVVPDNIEIISYEANRSGRWTLKEGVLAFYGTDINNLDYTVTYRVRSANIREAETLP